MKKVILYIILSVLLLPMLIQFTGSFKGRELEGIREKAKKPAFCTENYFNGTFQDSLNKYLDENFGLRTIMIRSYNQMLYSVFSKTFAPGVVIGKTGMMYIESYILSYAGINYSGEEKINDITRKIKVLQDTLHHYNKDLIIVLAPGKASFYPEFIPDSYFTPHHPINNYSGYKKSFETNQVTYIDLNSYFIQLKNNTKYPLFPRYGTHWTSYGVALAADTISHYIENQRKIDLAEIQYEEVILSDSLRGNDYDIGVLLNLQSKLYDKMPYPTIKYLRTDSTVKPSVLVVGDSYWWSMVGENIPANLFQEDEYWFYNKDIYINNGKQEKGVDEKNIRDEILKRDVIIVMATEATLNLFPFGFIESAYSKFCQDKEGRIQEIIKSMDGNQEWMKDIRRKAEENKVSLDEQKRADAIYLYDLENNKSD